MIITNKKLPLINKKTFQFPVNGINPIFFKNIIQNKITINGLNNLSVKTFLACKLIESEKEKKFICGLFFLIFLFYIVVSLSHWIGNIIFMTQNSDCVSHNFWSSVILYDTIFEFLFFLLIILIMIILLFFYFFKRIKTSFKDQINDIACIVLLCILTCLMGIKHLIFAILYHIYFRTCQWFGFPVTLSYIQLNFLLFIIIGIIIFNIIYSKIYKSITKMSSQTKNFIMSDIDNIKCSKMFKNLIIQREIYDVCSSLCEINPFLSILIQKQKTKIFLCKQ
jgi:hypothetical protein